MISNSIDGSSSSANPLMDLLKLVANPEEYSSKIKQMDEATARYNAAIALAGPADQILTLRDRAIEDRKAAEAELASAKKEAADIVAEAKASARQIEKAAKEKAAQVGAEADEHLKAAKSAESAASNAMNVAVQREVAADKKAVAAEKLAEKLKVETAAAVKAKADAEAVKNDIIAKHKAFIESLA